MTNKIIVGAFVVIIGTMAVKVFKNMKDNKEKNIEEVIEDEF